MRVLLVAINAKFIHSNPAVYSLKAYAEKYADYLPEDALTYVIDGGNHANYAYYGEQKGDGEATITREEQQEELLDLMAFYGF